MFRIRSRLGGDGLPSSLRRHTARLLALTLAVFSAPSFALITDRCEVDGGDLECVDPHMEETVCVGGMSVASSDPPCGPACRTPGEVISAINANWVAAFPLCSAVTPETCRDTSAPTETLTHFLGRVIRRRLQYDAQSSCDGNPPAYVTNCAQGDGLAIDCVTPMTCPPTYGLNPLLQKCTRAKSNACPTGNPIQCAGGQKDQHETDIAATGSGSLSLKRHYSSAGFYNQGAQPDEFDLFGHNWRHSYQHTLKLEQSSTTPTTEVAFLVRADGNYRSFRNTNGNWQSRVSGPDRLEEILNQGVRSGWRYTTANDEVEEYNLQGRLLSISTRAGQVTTLTYSAASTPSSTAPDPGMLIEVADTLGRRLSFRYTKDYYIAGVYQKRLIEVTDQAGDTVRYEFDENARLARTVYPDGKHRDYLYNTDLGFTHEGWNLLTGIVDENGNRYGTYKYDGLGRAIEEWHGSGTADKITVAYNGSYLTDQAYTLVTEKLGALIKRRFRFVNGEYRDEGTSRCGAPGCADSSVLNKTTNTYDTAGNLKSSTDFRGIVTDYSYNPRGLETARRENFVQPLGCPSGTTYYSSNFSSSCVGGTCWSTANFPGSSSAAPLGSPSWYYSCIMPIGTGTQTRTTETDWHATFAAPTERRIRNAANVIEARSQWAYNSRGQVVARCEIDVNDSAAMAYACSDTTAPAAGARVRRWTYTYCEAADVAASNSNCPILGYTKSTNGPRLTSDAGMNGLDDITSYAYYPSTDESGCGTLSGPCHRKGDLHTVTNALGHVTENVTYDKSGRIVRSRDPNGTITDAAYNTRGWMTSRTIRALASGAANADDATTGFTYNSAGMVSRITQPDGAYLNYTYDDAHRLTDVVDNLSNRIHYTLDAAGNQIKEEIFDSSYNPATTGIGLKRALSREFNTLGLLVKTLNASNASMRDSTPYDTSLLKDGYDAEGNQVQFKDGLNAQTQQSYDALGRLVKTIRDYTGTDPSTGNATTDYTYDSRHNLTSVKDPNGLSTSYTFNGVDELIGIDSPDTGHTAFSYDIAGNRKSRTDSRGVSSQYAYDALNRPLGISYPTTANNIAIRYDSYSLPSACAAANVVGRMTELADASGSMTFCYDHRGNLTSRTRTKGTTTWTTQYAYDRSDRVVAVTYPSGGRVEYVRDSIGEAKTATWFDSSSAPGVALVVNAEHYPFGALQRIEYANGRSQNRLSDANYNISRIESSDPSGLNLDLEFDVNGNITDLTSTKNQQATNRAYGYDRLGRLTTVAGPTSQILERYRYNKTGDRTEKEVSGSAPQPYQYSTGTHRLGSVAGVPRTYDSNGNTTSIGSGMSLTYDDRNRLSLVTKPNGSASYVYSTNGSRASKFVSIGSVTEKVDFVYDEAGRLLFEEQSNSSSAQISTTNYVYLDGVLVARISGGTIHYVETDHIGAPRVASDATTGSEVWRWEISDNAFGENSPNSSNGNAIEFRFPGQYFDEESALNYNYFRSYDASTGRYLESDPLGLRGGVSTYGYVNGSPLDSTDFHGLLRNNRGHWVPDSHGQSAKDRNKKKPKVNPPLKPEPENNMDWSPWADENFKIVCGRVTCCVSRWIACLIEPCEDLSFMGGYPSLNAVAAGRYNYGGRHCECHNWRFNDFINDPSTDRPPTLNGGEVLDMIGDFQRARNNPAVRGGR